MPQGGDDYGGARDAAFDRAVSEKVPAYEFFTWGGASKDRVDATSETLVETAPANFELRAFGRWGYIKCGKRALVP